MIIKSLKLKNYRNYDLLDLTFDPKTIFCTVTMLKERQTYWKHCICLERRNLTEERRIGI